MPFTNRFMIGIMAQVAQWEREQISNRTKAALAVANSRGRRIGGDRGNFPAVATLGASASAASRKRVAQDRMEKVRTYISEAAA